MDNENNKSVNIDTNSLTENDAVEESKVDSGSDLKSTLISGIAIILCAALLIFTLSNCFKKSAEANKSAAEKYSAGAVKTDDAFAPADDTAVPADDTASPADTPAADDTAVPADTPADTAAADDSSPADSTPAQDSGSQQSAAKTPSQTGTKAPSTKAEILNYFNTAINKVKPNAKSVTQTLEKNYQAKSIELGSLGALKGVVNNLIDKNMGVNKEKTGITATTVAEKNKIFPVENETWSSKLTMADIKDAKLVDNGSYYTVTITVKDDAPASTINHGQGHHAKAFSVVMPQTIIDNAGAAKSALKDLKVGSSDGKIVVKIDKSTGNVTNASYDFVWSLGVSSFGGITAYFGIIQEFSIKW